MVYKTLLGICIVAFVLSLQGCSKYETAPDRSIAGHSLDYSSLQDVIKSHMPVTMELEEAFPVPGDPRRILAIYFSDVYRTSGKFIISETEKPQNNTPWPQTKIINHHLLRINAAYRAFWNMANQVEADSLLISQPSDEAMNLIKNISAAIEIIKKKNTSIVFVDEYYAEANLELASGLLNLAENHLSRVYLPRKKYLRAKRYLKGCRIQFKGVMDKKTELDDNDSYHMIRLKKDIEGLRAMIITSKKWAWLKTALEDVSPADSAAIEGLKEAFNNTSIVKTGLEMFLQIMEGKKLVF
ncbi:MAG: hypothetical protein KAQ98_12550 [Bacteriovoracaceae bacterium]|nr:hypothetical protein [Bacteriovoracaceae bacterium]